MKNYSVDFSLQSYEKDSLIHRNNVYTYPQKDLKDIDISVIDSQYKIISQIIKNIAGLYEQNEYLDYEKIPDTQKLYDLLSMLMEYTKIHFLTKEKIWKYCNIETDYHEISNKNFIKTLLALRGCVTRYGVTNEDIKRIYIYLMCWLEKQMIDETPRNTDFSEAKKAL